MAIVHYRLTDDHQAPPIFFLPEKNGRSFNFMVVDEKDGLRKEVRYCDNEESVFVKDQNEKSRPTKIIFKNGNLSFDNETRPALEKVLDVHPASGKAFIKINLENEARKQIEQEELVTEAKYLIKKATDTEIQHLGTIYMPTADGISIQEMKAYLYNVASGNPKSIIENLSTKEAKQAVAIESLAKQALDKEIVYHAENKQSINWKDTDEPILKKSHLKNPEKALNEFMAAAENEAITNEIKKRLGA